MSMYVRAIEKDIWDYVNGESHKILFIWGPRRAGKTTLLSKISAATNSPIFNFDFISDREKFQPRREMLERIARECPLILIDEAQSYPESTLSLKLLHDEYKIKIIATGSSELRKKGQNFDSLAGRYEELHCLPFSVEEIESNEPPKAYETREFAERLSERFQVFGAYPEAYMEPSEARRVALLENILESYVLKDIINLYDLRNAKLARDILAKIALQIGQEVSVREIASSLQANAATVANYIEVFVKNYVLIPLPSFRTNLRRAVSENRKLYFYDLGVRNALVRDFRPVELRPDRGSLFENFIVSEIEKKRRIKRLPLSLYFYREYGGKEVDLVLESYAKEYRCLEIKSAPKKVAPVFPLPHEIGLAERGNFLEVIKSLR